MSNPLLTIGGDGLPPGAPGVILLLRDAGFTLAGQKAFMASHATAPGDWQRLARRKLAELDEQTAKAQTAPPSNQRPDTAPAARPGIWHRAAPGAAPAGYTTALGHPAIEIAIYPDIIRLAAHSLRAYSTSHRVALGQRPAGRLRFEDMQVADRWLAVVEGKAAIIGSRRRRTGSLTRLVSTCIANGRRRLHSLNVRDAEEAAAWPATG